MPHVDKNALSRFIRTECKRQLRLILCQAERPQDLMPPPQPPRPGLEQFTQAGEEWEALKLDDLVRTFGEGVILGTPIVQPSGLIRFRETALRTLIGQATPYVFLAEASFDIGENSAFEQ